MTSRPARPVPTGLLAAAALSGAAALALELLWGRLAARVFGASQYAVAVTLAAFMLGLGLGAAAGGALADRVRRPARLLALVEGFLALLGPGVTFVLAALPAAAAAVLPDVADAADPVAVAVRGLSAFAVLLLPAAAMGATFPLLVRAAARSERTLPRSLAALYGVNTLGGVAGALAAGFVLLPRWGVPGAVVGAAAADLAAAVLVLASAGAARPERTAGRRRSGEERVPPRLLALAAASGALVLGAEAVWNRALEVTLANSTATFTLLLALFLAGLGGGGAVAGRALRRTEPLRLWAALQIAAAAVLAGGAILLPKLPWLVVAVRPDMGWGRVLAAPLAVGGLVLLPLAFVLGAAWPALLAAAAPRVEDAGRHVGAMGLANAAGAAAGPLVATWGLLPAAGFGRTVLLLAAAHLALAAAVLPRRPLRTAVAAAAALAVAAVPVLPRFGRVLLPSVVLRHDGERVLFYRETPAAVVTVTVDRTGRFRSMFVDNNAAIGTTYDALKVTRMLGLLPVLLAPEPRDALVIGLGAGVTTAVVAGFGEVRSIEVAELVPAVAEASRLFEDLNHGVLRDPRVRLVFDDGRNHLLVTRRRYDLITCDPVHPLYGSAPLYTLDFFRMCRERLRPGGVMCQYLPLHHMPADAFRRAIATFRTAFPDCRVAFSLGHAVLVGTNGAPAMDWELWRSRLRTFRHPEDLADSVLGSPGQIAALLAAGPEGCRALALPPPATDLYPRLEFLAPAAFRPGLWEENARLLASYWRAPVRSIRNLPPAAVRPLGRLVEGKRLLLRSMIQLERGDLEGARAWLERALSVAPEDPELRRWRQHLASLRPRNGQ